MKFQSSWNGGVFPDLETVLQGQKAQFRQVSILLEWRSISRPKGKVKDFKPATQGFQSSWNGGVFPDDEYRRRPFPRTRSFNPLGMEEYFPTRQGSIGDPPEEAHRFNPLGMEEYFPTTHGLYSPTRCGTPSFNPLGMEEYFPTMRVREKRCALYS